VADLNSRTDSFIAMVLSVNGRVRSEDLTSIPDAERESLLQAYSHAHPELALHFEGTTLIAGPAAVEQSYGAPMPMPMPVSQAPQPAVPEPGGTAQADMPAEPSSIQAEEFIAPLPSAAGSPATPGQGAGIPEPDGAAFFVPPPPETPAPAPAVETVTPEKVSFVWWLLAVLVPVLGGLVSWLVVKGKNAKQATAMLLTSLIIGAVMIAAGFLLTGALGMALFGAASSAGSGAATQVTTSAPAAAPATGTAPK
jgi:hypothetical protein